MVKKIKWIVLAFVLSVPQALALKVVIVDRKKFTAADSQKLDQIVTEVNQVLNSPELKESILNFTYEGKREFVQNNGLTNEQIYETLMAGAEKYPKPTAANEQADLSLALYFPPWWKRWTSAVAFTEQNSPTIYLYAKTYFRPGEIPELAATLIHEWTHKVGFSHDFNRTARRPSSVPYAVGSMIEALVDANLNGKRVNFQSKSTVSASRSSRANCKH